MKTFDFIIVGAGITGSALAYELAKLKWKVLLIEKNADFDNATYYSYGGLAYWSGVDRATRQILQEGIEIHRNLTEELGVDTEFRDIDLLLTIPKDKDPNLVAREYQKFASKIDTLSIAETSQIEPLINSQAISGALRIDHAHIHPHKTNLAYQQAFIKLGGKLEFAEVIALSKDDKEDRHIIGVTTKDDRYYANKTIICAGGLSRRLLVSIEPEIPLYFTHALAIKIPPIELKLNSIVMPALQQRFSLEATANQLQSSQWNESNSEIIASILDAGAVQFKDGSLCLGQISELSTDPQFKPNMNASEKRIRQAIADILPALADRAGTCHHCLVAFTDKSFPCIGKISGYEGVESFSGFTSTLIFAPPMARRYAESFQI
jgi:glycine/D-amino acid oxidase-like deaminating enzyme